MLTWLTGPSWSSCRPSLAPCQSSWIPSFQLFITSGIYVPCFSSALKHSSLTFCLENSFQQKHDFPSPSSLPGPPQHLYILYHSVYSLVWKRLMCLFQPTQRFKFISFMVAFPGGAQYRTDAPWLLNIPRKEESGFFSFVFIFSKQYSSLRNKNFT